MAVVRDIKKSDCFIDVFVEVCLDTPLATLILISNFVLALLRMPDLF